MDNHANRAKSCKPCAARQKPRLNHTQYRYAAFPCSYWVLGGGEGGRGWEDGGKGGGGRGGRGVGDVSMF